MNVNLSTISKIGLVILGLVFYRQVLVVGMILGGKVIAPEASSILQHYCFGSGDTLVLDNSYIKQSPVVKKHLQQMKQGESRKVRLKQSEDWRLSYALNPFTITKTDSGVVINQFIKFKQQDYTYLNILGHKIKVQDDMVHCFDCEPFEVICKW